MSLARRSVRTSLRAQVAVVIGVLAILPNVVLAVAVLLPALGGTGVLSPTTWLAVILWLGAMVIASALIGYLLSRQVLAPLTRVTRDVGFLQDRARRLATVRLRQESSNPAEVASLRLAFNDLLDLIQLEQERRSSFMAAVMHDLKTPLVASNHLLQLLGEGSDLDREGREAIVTQLLTENRALIGLVQEMVDAHRFERNDPELHLEELDLGVLVRRIVDRVSPLAGEREVIISVQGTGRALADARELERALYNLVANAVRYARSRIDLELFAGLIRLSDDGPGLPLPLEELAQPFRAEPIEIGGKRFLSGMGGLGLFIARRLIEAHGGRLTTETTGPMGTTLLIYLGTPDS